MTLTVEFDGSESSGGDSEAIIDCVWGFGDATIGSGIAVSHTYPSAGDYDASLTVTNACGRSDTNTQCVRVTEEIPIVGDIKGRVVDQEDIPIVDAKATVVETGQFNYTDSEGYFVITSVAVGIHTIEISREGYATEYIDVDIAEGLNELVEPIMLSTAKISLATIIAGAALLAGILATIMTKR